MEIKQSPLNKARKDKFLMVFDLPPALKPFQTKYNRSNRTLMPDSVQWSIWGTMIPDITVKGVETRFAGSTLYVSSHSKDSYPPVNVKFLVDNEYSNYWTIYSWLNLLHDQKQGIPDQRKLTINRNHTDYQTDLTIYALDENNKKRMAFKYTKAFPTTLNGLEYTEQATGEMELESGFTFLYSQLHVEVINEDIFNETLDN